MDPSYYHTWARSNIPMLKALINDHKEVVKRLLKDPRVVEKLHSPIGDRTMLDGHKDKLQEFNVYL